MVSANSIVLMALLGAAPSVEIWEFTAPWCPACQSMEPVVQRLVDENIPVRQIPVDDYQELAAQAEVTHLPSFVLVIDGRILNRTIGEQSIEQLRAFYDSGRRPASGSGDGRLARTVSPRDAFAARNGSVVRGQQAAPRPFERLGNALSSLTGRGVSETPANPGASESGALASGTAGTFDGLPPEVAPASVTYPLSGPPIQPPSSIASRTSGSMAGYSSEAFSTPTPLAPLSFASSSQPEPVAGLASARSHTAGNPGPADDPVQTALDATLLIRVHDPMGISLGTGTIVDVRANEALVLTCGHIFREAGESGTIACELQGRHAGHKAEGVLIGYDLKRDVGLISIRTGQPLQPIQIAGPGHQPGQGDTVFAIGCGRGAPASVIRNQIIAVNRYNGPANLVVGGRPIDGRSGGGLFSEDGRLIGVCNAADPELDEGIYAALGPIHAELDARGLGFIFRNPKTGSDREGSPGVSREVAPAVTSAGSLAFADAAPQGMLSTGMQAPASATSQPSAGDTEVICIVRPKGKPFDAGRAYVLDKPSPGLLHQLSEELGKRGPHEFTSRRHDHAPPVR